jgi:hypothetical protein
VKNAQEWGRTKDHPEISSSQGGVVMAELHLTPEQEAEAQTLCQRLKSAFEREALQLARLRASKDDRHLLGAAEFEVRDQVHRLGTQELEAVLQERKKKGTRGRVSPVRTARRVPAVSATAPRPS